jgi:hypothetical protein
MPTQPEIFAAAISRVNRLRVTVESHWVGKRSCLVSECLPSETVEMIVRAALEGESK